MRKYRVDFVYSSRIRSTKKIDLQIFVITAVFITELLRSPTTSRLQYRYSLENIANIIKPIIYTRLISS